MKSLLAIPLVLICLMSSPSLGSDFEKGVAAVQSGDFATALREWTPLAEQGHAQAQYNLGLMYERGDGVLQDYKTAVKWYTLAAEQDVPRAQNNLGLMYRKGNGVLQDDKIAVKWYTLAAEQGFANAQTNLGLMYGKGTGITQDLIYAHMWLNIAASNGDKKAADNREIAAENMTPSQIEKAQDLARECVAKNYKGC